jgi:hypothetical protein
METIVSLKELPPTLNDIIGSARRNRFGSAALKKKWTNALALAARQQSALPIKGEVYLEYIWRVKNRRRDQDNITAAQKYILDGLVAAGIIEEDNLKIVRTPVIHHVVIDDHDGFSIIIRSHSSFLLRLAEHTVIEVPDVDISEIKSGQSSITPVRKVGRSTKKKAATRRLTARRRSTIK